MNQNAPSHQTTVHEHFACRYAPFSDTFVLRDSWASKADAENLRRMLLLLEQGKSFSLVGEPGTGKSMLLKTLLDRLDPKDLSTRLHPLGGTENGSDHARNLRQDRTRYRRKNATHPSAPQGILPGQRRTLHRDGHR